MAEVGVTLPCSREGASPPHPLPSPPSETHSDLASIMQTVTVPYGRAQERAGRGLASEDPSGTELPHPVVSSHCLHVTVRFVFSKPMYSGVILSHLLPLIIQDLGPDLGFQ